jgi:hypothetical protein
MTIESIEKDFKRKVCDQIRLEAEGLNRFLLEVINAAAAREKSIRHGLPSTLHL